MTMRRISRRQVLAGMPLLVLPRNVSAGDDYSGQYIQAETKKTAFLGPETPPTEHLSFKTAGTLPVLRAKQGVEFRFRVFNKLPEELWLHLYGVRGPSEMMAFHVDAGPNNDLEVVFTPKDAGTFWIGPLLQSARFRELGLVGMLIVEEADDLRVEDVPLLIKDWALDDNGVVESDFANLNVAAGEGRAGNWFSVNGTTKPTVTLSKDKPTRLRLLNSCNARRLSLRFKNFLGQQIAIDGQPSPPEALGLSAFSLLPGQRLDFVALEASAGAALMLELPDDNVELAFFEGLAKAPSGQPRLPDNPLPTIDLTTVPREITLGLEGGVGGRLVSAKVGRDILGLRAMLEQGLAWSIGTSAGLGAPPLFDANFGELLQLTFVNNTAFDQPMHLHGHVWTKAGAEPQWSDTLLVPKGGTEKVLMIADNPGTWAIQSLIAERSDAGLIGVFTVPYLP
jgi:FtsP/CotA-like multicopper oxidase with cupredoxin domain